jgi:hypothetical protein
MNVSYFANTGEFRAKIAYTEKCLYDISQR